MNFSRDAPFAGNLKFVSNTMPMIVALNFT